VRGDVRQRLADIADRLTTPDRTAEPHVLEGRPATEIVAEAGRSGADLVVIGARGVSAAHRLLLGSVSAEVADHAPCPVLVARTASVDRLQIATDGSADGERATAFVASCGLFDTSRIRVVSVIDPTLPWWAAMAPTDATIAGDTYAGASDAARGRAAVAVDTAGWLLGTPSTTIARTGVDGDVASAILAEARACEADVVAVGTRGNSGVKRLLLGSVSRNVLHHAPMSVLIVRPTVASRSTSQREEPVAAAV
jgi:nucleotide-binding universal stress UspA family protein